MRSMRVLALGGVLMLGVACSGRATRTEAAAGSAAVAGSAGAASGGASVGGTSSGGASSGGASPGGVGNVAGQAGGVQFPQGCGYAPEGPAAEEGALASPEVVWDRIGLFLADEMLPAQADFPPATTPEWAGDAALALLDSFGQDLVHPPGLTRFFGSWMPELEDPALWAGIMTQNAATMSDILLFSPSSPGGPALGILTDHGFLTSKPSIGARGAWMLEHMFCAAIPPHPAGIPELVPMPNMTRREEYLALLNDPSCAACHVNIDPLGFSLENFDASGMYVEVDDGFPIDSSGSYFTPQGLDLTFSSIEDLAPQLVYCEVARCWSMRLFDYARTSAGVLPVELGNTPDANRVANRFGAANFGLRELIRAIVESPAFLRP